MTIAKKKKIAAALIAQLRALYEKGALSQRDMARLLRVDATTLNRWFRKGTSPTSSPVLSSMDRLIKLYR